MKTNNLCCVLDPTFACDQCGWRMCITCFPLDYNKTYRGMDATLVAANHKRFAYCKSLMLQNLHDPHRSVSMYLPFGYNIFTRTYYRS